ncbi:MAG: EMC3/TMCO1 family protein [Nanoarchaeota archaeon]
MLESFFNAIFFFKDFMHPALSLSIIAVILTFLVTLVYKFTTNQEKMKDMKEELKILQDQMKEHKGDPKKVMELQKQAMEKNLAYMKHSFRPTLYTFLPLIVVFSWLRTTYGGDPAPVLLKLPLVGGLTWIWFYIIISVVSSMIIRKIFKIY